MDFHLDFVDMLDTVEVGCWLEENSLSLSLLDFCKKLPWFDNVISAGPLVVQDDGAQKALFRQYQRVLLDVKRRMDSSSFCSVLEQFLQEAILQSAIEYFDRAGRTTTMTNKNCNVILLAGPKRLFTM